MLFGHPTLTLIRAAMAVDLFHRCQLLLTFQHARDGLQPGQQVVEVLGNQPLVTVLVQDDDGVKPVTRTTPLVFLHMPGRHGGQRFPSLQLAIQVDHQAMGQRHQRLELGDIGDPVEYPDLYSAKCRRRSDVPADFVELVDDSGLHLIIDKSLELFPRLEVEGQPGGRQLLKHHGPVTGVPGVLSLPHRRRC